ncbi:MAG: hypothetical protein ACK56F_27465, partial [bacterium]
EKYDHLDKIVNLFIRATGPKSKIGQKKAACDLIAVLGEQLKEVAEHVMPTYHVSKKVDDFETIYSQIY